MLSFLDFSLMIMKFVEVGVSSFYSIHDLQVPASNIVAWDTEPDLRPPSLPTATPMPSIMIMLYIT